MTDSRAISEFSERQLIARIGEILPILDDVQLGPGDDAALITAPDGSVVVATDVLVEERHFFRDWISAADLGRRAMAQNLADIAAMGARPTAVVVALTVPGELPISWLDGLTRGLAESGGAAGVSVAGGDLVRAEKISVAVSALGSMDGVAPVLRSGAGSGDVLAHAGNAGWGAAGFALLEARMAGRGDFTGVHDPSADELIATHLVPRPPLAAGIAAQRAGATAMLDVSDGLLRDGQRIARASNVTLDLEESALELYEAPLRGAAQYLGRNTRDWVLSGGEDHGLLATFPTEAIIPEAFTPIGQVRAAKGQPGVLISGQPVGLSPGWDHFSG